MKEEFVISEQEDLDKANWYMDKLMELGGI